ncbi:MAG: glycosyltransferase family 4 protein, partial [Rhodococcus fascians]
MTESGCRRRGGADVARILFAHDTTEFGGVEMVILRTLERLDRSRFQPVVLVPGTSDPDRASPAEFIDRVSDLGVDVVEYSVREVRVIGPAIEIGSIARAVRSVRPDVVHLHTCRVEGARKVVVGARIARVPVVLRTEHNSPTAFSKPPLDSPNRRIFDRLTDRVVTVSEHDRSEQIELVGRSPNRVVAIRNGVDHLEFDPRSEGVVPVLLDG